MYSQVLLAMSLFVTTAFSEVCIAHVNDFAGFGSLLSDLG
jgi:hypothetical protein